MTEMRDKSLQLAYFDEPELEFGFSQKMADPRDGLTLFGPAQGSSIYGINYALIGTQEGIKRFYKWLPKIQKRVSPHDSTFMNNRYKRVAQNQLSTDLWIPYPGFEEAFGVPISNSALHEAAIDQKQLQRKLSIEDVNKRVYETVSFFLDRMEQYEHQADENISIWFVIIPEPIFRACRPNSSGIVTSQSLIKNRKSSSISSFKKKAHEFRAGQSSLFEDHQSDYFPYEYRADFRKQLKIRRILSNANVPVQLLRETTLAPNEFTDNLGNLIRPLEPPSQVAWNLTSSVFYKSGGKPWRLGRIRKGVCYLGLVFKHLDIPKQPRFSCCAAQMFLDNGDGVVFKGATGPWRSLDRREFHLNEESAREIIEMAAESYRELSRSYKYPDEIFIHGRTYLNEDEWNGFSSITDKGVRVVAVRIAPSNLMLFRQGKYPLLRGTAYINWQTRGHFWSTGFVPRLKTSPFSGFPKPLDIKITHGDAHIDVVIQDIFALTKLNYNSCHYGDGKPITIQFADMIGDILTSGPIEKNKAPLAFKFYI